MIRFQDGAYNKKGVKAFTLQEACDILGKNFADVKRVNFQTNRNMQPMTDEVKAKLRAITSERRSVTKDRRKKKRSKR